MLIPTTARGIRALVHDPALPPDSAIAPPEVLEMLADLTASIESRFAPAAWFIAEGGKNVGLCSLTRMPEDGELHIGYGVALDQQGRGVATHAVADLLRWAQIDARVRCVSAETAVDNLASQRVLERNGFRVTGRRVDPDDGPVLCWSWSAA